MARKNTNRRAKARNPSTNKQKNAAVNYFEKKGLRDNLHNFSSLRGGIRQADCVGLDIIRRQILDALGALLIFDNGSREFSHSKLFYSTLKDICSSVLERDKGHEAISELLVRDMFCYTWKRVHGIEKEANWMPECWAATVFVDDDIQPEVALKFLHKKTLPEDLKARLGGSLMHLGAARHRFDESVMNAISSPQCARWKDKESQRLPLHWAAKCSRSIAMLKYVFALNPKATKQEDIDGMTPLALVISQAPFPEQVEMVKYLATADPESCKTVSKDKHLNLFHFFAKERLYKSSDGLSATCTKGILDLFQTLLEVVPREYLLKPNTSLDLPLHLLCDWNPLPTEIISAMISACPDSAKVTDNCRNLPLDCVLERMSFFCHKPSSSLDGVKLLIEAYPEGVVLNRIICSNPLRKYPKHMMAIVQAHIERFPDSLCAVTDAERTFDDDKPGYLPLHHACRFGDLKLVRLLFEKYPEAVSRFTDSGRLPLHVAIKNYGSHLAPLAAYDKVIRFLLQKFPQAVSMKLPLKVDEDEDEDEEDEEEDEGEVEEEEVEVGDTDDDDNDEVEEEDVGEDDNEEEEEEEGDGVLTDAGVGADPDNDDTTIEEFQEVLNEDEEEDEGEGPQHGEADNNGRISCSPIEVARFKRLPIPTQRLILRLCPKSHCSEADKQRLRELNYEARRPALFLGFTAMLLPGTGGSLSKQQTKQKKKKGKNAPLGSKKNAITKPKGKAAAAGAGAAAEDDDDVSSFVYQLRHLIHMDADMPLFKHMVSFL